MGVTRSLCIFELYFSSRTFRDDPEPEHFAIKIELEWGKLRESRSLDDDMTSFGSSPTHRLRTLFVRRIIWPDGTRKKVFILD